MVEFLSLYDCGSPDIGIYVLPLHLHALRQLQPSPAMGPHRRPLPKTADCDHGCHVRSWMEPGARLGVDQFDSLFKFDEPLLLDVLSLSRLLRVASMPLRSFRDHDGFWGGGGTAGGLLWYTNRVLRNIISRNINLNDNLSDFVLL